MPKKREFSEHVQWILRLLLFQTPHDGEEVATFAGHNESETFHRLDGIAIGGQRTYFFIVFQPPQEWVTAERISFKLVSVLNVRRSPRKILPKLFGYISLLLAAVFVVLGVTFLLTLMLPARVTAFAGVQALWWLAAAMALIARSGKISRTMGEPEFDPLAPGWSRTRS